MSRLAILATSNMIIMVSMDAMAAGLNINAPAFIPNNAAAPIMANGHQNHQRDNRNGQIIAPNIQNNGIVLVQERIARDFIALNNRTVALDNRLGMLNENLIRQAIQQIPQTHVQDYLQNFLDNRFVNNQNAIFAPGQNNDQALQQILGRIIQMNENEQRDFGEFIANQEITVENLEAIINQHLVRANQGEVANAEEVLSNEDVDANADVETSSSSTEITASTVEFERGNDGERILLNIDSGDESEDNLDRRDNIRVFTQNNHVLE
ncbi:hypothetical protein OAP56_02580, partial [Rickettsiaceae bacterium]|nr:hypothetical protein [Rickettsiaceae bacterium]MDC0864815.1 hypothetical protein [Rickettsiaceae bacterium]